MGYRNGTKRREFLPTDPASPQQLSTLDDMLADRLLTDAMREGVEAEILAGVNRGQASALMQYVGACDRTPEAEARHRAEMVTEPGLYRHDGRLYEVVQAKNGDHLYALNYETGEFAKGMFPRLKASEREEAG